MKYFTDPGVKKTRVLFGFEEARKALKRGAPALYVTESTADVLALAQAGLAGVASLGEALAPEQVALIKMLVKPSTKLVLAAHNDDAGAKYTLKNIESLRDVTPGDIAILDPGPGAKDVGDLVGGNTKVPAPRPWEMYLRDLLVHPSIDKRKYIPALASFIGTLPPIDIDRIVCRIAAMWGCSRDRAIALLQEKWSASTSGDICSVDDLAREYENQMQFGTTGTVLGLKTIDIDTRGIWRGEVCFILGRPAVGKTTFALNIARLAALAQSKRVVFFSMEMGKVPVFERLAQIELSLRRDEVEDMARNKPADFAQARARLRRQYSKLTIVHRGNLTIEQIESHINESTLTLGGPPELVIIDYLGQVRGKGQNQYERTSLIAQGLKRLAKDMDCSVIVLSQVSRSSKADPTEEVKLTDGRDSGCIEESGDLVLGLWLDLERHLNPRQQGGMLNRLNVRVLKSRRGGLGARGKLTLNETLLLKEFVNTAGHSTP